MDGDLDQLGRRFFRVLLSSPGQPFRFRTLHFTAIEDHPRSDHDGGLRRIFDVVYESAAETRLPMGFVLLVGCGLLCVSGLNILLHFEFNNTRHPRLIDKKDDTIISRERSS